MHTPAVQRRASAGMSATSIRIDLSVAAALEPVTPVTLP
jgi:hypothetical protein